MKVTIRGHRIGRRFRRAYILLYRGLITGNAFCRQCGIADPAEAWATLSEYRARIVAGEIPAPRTGSPAPWL